MALRRRLDLRLGLRITAFTLDAFDQASFLVVEVLVRPDRVAVALPNDEVVVEHDRPGHAEPLCGGRNVCALRRKIKLRRVNADDYEPFVAIAPVPFAQVGQRTKAVDAGVLPKIDEHDLSAKLRGIDWSAVQPTGAAGKACDVVGKLGRRPSAANPRSRANQNRNEACDAAPPPSHI